MITLHHLEKSRSHRVLWILEELEIPYKIKHYKRNPKTLLAPTELMKIHPLGKSPVITDDKLVIAESSVIIEYLIDSYDTNNTLRPLKGSKEYLNYLYFLHAAEGSFMTYLFLSFVMSQLSKPPVPLLIRPIAKGLELGLQSKLIQPNVKRQFQYLEQILSKRKYLAGNDFTAADIQMSYPLLAAESRIDLRSYKNLDLYLKKLKKRNAYIKALEIGGPIEL